MKHTTWWRGMIAILTINLALTAWFHEPYFTGFNICLIVAYTFLLPDQQADSKEKDGDG